MNQPIPADGVMPGVQDPTSGLVDRAPTVRINMCICNYDKERGTMKMSLPKALQTARTNVMAVNLRDDNDQPLIGHTIPSTVTIDGPLIMADVDFQLEVTHVVEKLFGVKNADPEEVARMAAVRSSIATITDDVVLELNTMACKGATDAEITARAAAIGLPPQAAEHLLYAIREMQKAADAAGVDAAKMEQAVAAIAPALASAVREEVTNPTDPAVGLPTGPSAGGAGELTGRMGVDARITGEVVAKLSPDGSVG